MQSKLQQVASCFLVEQRLDEQVDLKCNYKQICGVFACVFFI